MEEKELNELLSWNYMAEEILKVHRLIKRNVNDATMYKFAFRRIWMVTGEKTKTLTAIDLRAEANFIENLTLKFGADKIYVVGEESLYEGLDLSEKGKGKICVLVDMIDGTDLLERKMSNWCSAIIVFDPEKPEVLGAYVYLAEEKAYREAKSAEEVRFRFYNLAGNPMMVRLLEGYFDVVAEPKGQHPHDMAAGAFIAAQGGAVLLTKKGKVLELAELAKGE